MKMKKTLNWLITFLLITNAIILSAQPGKPGERIKQLRVAFITEELDLTVEESEKFWPVFNKYDKQRFSIKQELKELRDAVSQSTSESDLLNKMTRMTELRKQQADIDLQMFKDLVPVLPPQKLSILMGLEEEFKKKLMQRIKERRRE